MKKSLLLASLLSSLFCASAFAEPTTDPIVALVTKTYVKPLQARESKRSRYSRMAMPPAERRVKIVDTQTDATGAAFTNFVVEERSAFDPDQQWMKAETGCAYASTGAVFVKLGDKLRAAEFYLGKKPADPPATACVVSSPRA
jgi:hypothetical protein